ncbi:MAG TPA: hypothetical protein VNV43_05370 [Candidatus Acidoferrales bacterium]|nr:hypothetical protein [Candidatus Acidoferrales bacterium]
MLQLPGIYPTEVLFGLSRLLKTKQIPEVGVIAVELEAASRPIYFESPVAAQDRRIEHPLDFEWHFSKEGAKRVCEEILRLCGKDNGEVLCLGCPSVYAFGKQNLKNYNFRLWDKNVRHLGQIEEAREVACVDVFDSFESGKKADFVVLDPPWYNPYYLLFLWAAAHCLAKGGYVVLSFPPEGTRPSVKTERRELVLWCKRNGFQIEKRIPNSLKYRSPLFEVNALKAQGVTKFPLDWRRGDLFVLKKSSDEVPAKPDVLIPNEKWEEVRVGHVRIKVSCSKKSGRGLLVPAMSEAVIPSVSSRHPARRLANVVTSGNRFLCTNAPEELVGCLSLLKSNGAKSMVDSFLAAKNPLLMRKALDLILSEEIEAADYFWRINEI